MKGNKKKNPYLERRSLDHGGEFPSLLVPCLKPTSHCGPSPPSPLVPASRQQGIYLHTDNITCLFLLGRAQQIVFSRFSLTAGYILMLLIYFFYHQLASSSRLAGVSYAGFNTLYCWPARIALQELINDYCPLKSEF
jgi:hypothetical protein